MKTGRSITIIVLLTSLLLSCGSKKEDTAGPEDTGREWKEMDDFHMVMAEVFHPYKDSADLAPVRSKVGELVTAAGRWADARLPEKVDNDEMRERLKELEAQSRALQEVVQTGEDPAIGEQLTKVHDLFHHIQELWYGGDEHGHDH
jgi:hypothetical protein